MNIGAWLPPASAARPAPPAAGLGEACPEPQGRVEWARPEQFCGPPGGSLGGAGRSLGGPRDPRPLSLLPGLGPGAVSAVEKAASSCLSSACQGRGRTRTTSLFGGRLLWGLPSGNGGLWGWAPALKRPSRCSSTEPAILVMHHSMKPHPAITATLLDFMCRVRAASRAPGCPGPGACPPDLWAVKGPPLPSTRPGVSPRCPAVSASLRGSSAARLLEEQQVPGSAARSGQGRPVLPVVESLGPLGGAALTVLPAFPSRSFPTSTRRWRATCGRASSPP